MPYSSRLFALARSIDLKCAWRRRACQWDGNDAQGNDARDGNENHPPSYRAIIGGAVEQLYSASPHSAARDRTSSCTAGPRQQALGVGRVAWRNCAPSPATGATAAVAGGKAPLGAGIRSDQALGAERFLGANVWLHST